MLGLMRHLHRILSWIAIEHTGLLDTLVRDRNSMPYPFRSDPFMSGLAWPFFMEFVVPLVLVDAEAPGIGSSTALYPP